MLEVCAHENTVFTLWAEGMFRTLVKPNVSLRQMLRGCQSSLTLSACYAAKHLLLERKSQERAEVRRAVEGDSLGKRRERKWTEIERQF